MEYLGHTQSTVYTFGPRITSAGTKSESGFSPSMQTCTSKHYMTAGPPPDMSSQRTVTAMNCDQTSQDGRVTSALQSGSAKCRLHSGGPTEKLAPDEWKEWSRAELSAADRARSKSELVRADVLTACRGLCERTRRTQADTTHRLGDRTNDIKFWRDEIRAEADAASAESAALDSAISLLDRAFVDAEVPLQIAEECLHLREQRIGVDLVRDEVEIQLIKVTTKFCLTTALPNIISYIVGWKWHFHGSLFVTFCASAAMRRRRLSIFLSVCLFVSL